MAPGTKVADMATLVLVRHGRTTANADGILAGRLPRVRLDETGRGQVRATGERLAAVPLVRLMTSPMARCRQTAQAVLDHQGDGLALETEPGIAECDYGDWQGRPIKELAKEPLWKTIQRQPSAVTFPGGEPMTTMQSRAVTALRRRDAEVEAEHGARAVWAAVSHGDIIKAVLADALGMHLDLFQRLHVDPASVSIIRYAPDRPYVLASNTHAGDLSWLAPAQESAQGPAQELGQEAPADDAVIGGGAGPTAAAPRDPA